MALSIRSAGYAVIAFAVACTPAPQTIETKHTSHSFKDAPKQAGRDTVAVLTPLEAETKELWSALVLELKDDFNVVTVPVDRATTARNLGLELDELVPNCVVVVDNRTLQLYRELQARRPGRTFPPAVVVMTSFLDGTIRGLRSAMGIAYEVPAVSGVVALREVSTTDIKRVGVVHRQNFTNLVHAQAELLAVEKVQLVPASLKNTPTPEEIEDSLDDLVVSQNVDALWVLNDNRLLTPELLMSSWLPVLRFKPIPVIVGISALVHPDVHFGTLAVFPNHARLGVQAANLVFDLYDNDWQLVEQAQVDLPLSVNTVVDVAIVDDYFGLKADALSKIDQAVK